MAASNYSFSFAPGTLTITNKWTTNGFFQPVDMDKVNTVKAGSDGPAQFEVLLGRVKVCDVSLVQSLRYREVVTVAGLQTDEIELLATGGTVLRCDGTQYIYNWSTRG